MIFTFTAPPPALAATVKTIWIARGTKAEFDAPDPIVPDGCVELIVNLGDPFADAAAGQLQPRGLLAGQMTHPVVAQPTGAVDLIGVRFRPGRAGAALRTPMWELRDRLVDASAVLAPIHRVVEELGGVPVAARLAVLEKALSKALAPVDEPRLSAIEQALAIVGDRRGNVGVETVARRAGVTRRHLERRFQDEVGLGVKEMARIARLHAALALIGRPSPPGGAEIAARCGFSDQAHLIRECRAWTGRTPARFAREATSLAGLIREPAPA